MGSLTPAEKNRRDRAIPDRASVVVQQNANLDPLWRPERDQTPLGCNVRALRRGMRPAGISGTARRMAPVRGNDAKGRYVVRPLSVEAVEFSPVLVPENSLIFGWKTMSSGAGGVIPAVVADPPIPTAAGVTFSAVAEVHVSASASDEDSLVAQASEQHIVCNTDPGKVPAIPGDTLVNKPMMHSAQKIDLDGIPMEEVVVLEPLAFSVPGVSRRPMEGVTSPAPLVNLVKIS